MRAGSFAIRPCSLKGAVLCNQQEEKQICTIVRPLFWQGDSSSLSFAAHLLLAGRRLVELEQRLCFGDQPRPIDEQCSKSAYACA